MSAWKPGPHPTFHGLTSSIRIALGTTHDTESERAAAVGRQAVTRQVCWDLV